MIQHKSDKPVFGAPLQGRKYIERPGAYAIIFDAMERVAVVKTSLGYFLPGGGQDPGEQLEDTVKRETQEECGFDVEVIYKIGEAEQFVHGPDGAYFLKKQCRFFRVNQSSKPCRRSEPGHELCWLSIEEAEEKLAEECQVWALRKDSRLTQNATSTSILLIRHGESEGNRSQVIEGLRDSPLSTRGCYQAKCVANWLQQTYPDVARLYSSPLQRAVQTAYFIKRVLHLPLTIEPDLREGSLGEWEGMSFQEVEEIHQFSARIKEDSHFAEHKGESPYELARRVSTTIRRIGAENQGKRVVVVSHGAAITFALAMILGTEPICSEKYEIQNGGVTELILAETPQLLTSNYVGHLN